MKSACTYIIIKNIKGPVNDTSYTRIFLIVGLPYICYKNTKKRMPFCVMLKSPQ